MIETHHHSSFYGKKIDPTAFHQLSEYSSPARNSHDDKLENKGNAIGAGRTVMNKRPHASREEGNPRKERSHLSHAPEDAQKATRPADHDEKVASPTGYQPCNYTQWDVDLPPINMSSSAYKEALHMVQKHFTAWQHEVALSGEILLDKINTREQRHALIEVAKSFGYNPSNPRATTCSFVYVKYTNRVFMRATGEKIPYIAYEIARDLQRLEQQHQAYMDWRHQQQEMLGNAGNKPQVGDLMRAPEGEGVGEGANMGCAVKSNGGKMEQQQRLVSAESCPNYQQPLSASQIPQPCVLRWWFVDRYAHRDVMEILRLLACEIGVFRGEPSRSFDQLQRCNAEAAKNLENPMIFRVEVALEYRPSWAGELEALLKEQPGSVRDPYPISYIRRDNFVMRQYQRYLRPFFYDWRPVVTRCFVDLFQGRDFRAGSTPSNVVSMGTAFFLRHEMDPKGQVFYRRWVRRSLELFGAFSPELRRQDTENVRETLRRLYHASSPASEEGGHHAEGGIDREGMLELLKQAKNATPHFGTLNLCNEFHYFKKDLPELQKFSARYGYFLYVRHDDKMVYVAATARDLPVLPPQRFQLFFLPNGAYVGPPTFHTYVDLRMGEAEAPFPPSLTSLIEGGFASEGRRRRARELVRRGGSFSSRSASSEREGERHRSRRQGGGGRGRAPSLASSPSLSRSPSASFGGSRRGRSRSPVGVPLPPPTRHRGRSASPKDREKIKEIAPLSLQPRQRRYAVPSSLPASSLYDVMVGANQRLSHNPGCTVESHLVEWEDTGSAAPPPRVLHFALNHLTREAHIIGG
ncbi:unnamed protein product [Phytomonas sp. EM1]|nr:unnamed protein product [Phytomonas sp. EM1]|eukprot:CCW61271.1 unnamed protein product [Phytomonas sp. isolate EM1]